MIINFLIESIYVESSLGLEKGFEGMGGINFLKSDLFFLIFTTTIVFLEYFLYISYNSIKGLRRRILNEKTLDGLFSKWKRSCFLRNRLLYFLILISILYISDNYIKIFLNMRYQFIIIDFFLHFILCFICGTLFFSLIIVTLDLKILQDSIIVQKLDLNDKIKQMKTRNIYSILTVLLSILFIGSLMVLIFNI